MFQQPKPAPYELGTETASIADLLSAPATQAILVRHIPFLARPPEQLKPHLGNFTVHDLLSFPIPGINAKAAADIDADLKQLPRTEWPSDAR
jgi:hypothetical protein